MNINIYGYSFITVQLVFESLQLQCILHCSGSGDIWKLVIFCFVVKKKPLKGSEKSLNLPTMSWQHWLCLFHSFMYHIVQGLNNLNTHIKTVEHEYNVVFKLINS